jgi:Permuted papain-like amidase enzyme, YaeF/YiiX, C92 family
MATGRGKCGGASYMSQLALLLMVLLCAAAASAAQPAGLRDGDLIFHSSRSAQSLAIQRATHSPFSHMGVIIHRGGQPFVFEAIARVQYTPLRKWIERGDQHAYAIKRLKKPFTQTQVRALRAAAANYAGKPYDLYFEWSDERIYCSELAWKMYRDALGVEIGARQELRQFDLTDPVVKAKMRERYGARVPLDEPVISPADMFDSPLLEQVVGD